MVKKAYDSLTGAVVVFRDEMFPEYLIESAHPAIVDGAISVKGAFIAVSVRSRLAEKALEFMLLTHSHYDHVGAIPYLQSIYPMTVIASARAAQIFANPDALTWIAKYNTEFAAILKEPETMAFTKIERVQVARAGDAISLGGDHIVKVYETPGHTRCSLSFYLLPEKVLFIGDAGGVYERNGRLKPLFLSSYLQYDASLQLLSGIDADIVAMAHNRPIRGRDKVIAFFKHALATCQELRAVIQKELANSSDAHAIAETLLAREYPDPTLLGPRDTLMVNVVAMVNAVKREFS